MIAGIVIAAGRSTRLGRPKQLLPLAGRPLLSHVVEAALASRLDEVLLVLGHEAPAVELALAATVAGSRTRIVVNPRFAEGQATSLVAGVAALRPEAEAALILLGDQPGVRAATIDLLLDAFAAHRPPIVAPVYDGDIGNPILFRRDLFPDLARLTGDEGARRLVRRRFVDVLRVDSGLAAPPPDVDTEADYEALLAAWDDTLPARPSSA